MLLDRSEHSRSQNLLHTSHANSFTDKEENSLCQTESPLIKILQTAEELEKHHIPSPLGAVAAEGPTPTGFLHALGYC